MLLSQILLLPIGAHRLINKKTSLVFSLSVVVLALCTLATFESFLIA